MSDLIGRFLSFEEHLGRGLVKFAYYVALFYLIVISLFEMITFLFGGKFGEFILVPFGFLLQLLLLRVGAELIMAVLSIDDNLQGNGFSADGVEAGLTPAPTTPSSSPPPSDNVSAPETTVHTAPPAPSEETSSEDEATKVEPEESSSPKKD
ncbi:MAG: DUF4282 domain-containing protein [Pseudomonadota bacterium]